MSEGFVLSIVIPTRNRLTCAASLLSMLERYHEEGHRFQVVISDNSDDDGLRARVQASALNVDYEHRKQMLSVVDNFNLALARVRGKYVCFVGDDDIVSARIFDVVETLDRLAIEAAIISDAVTSLYYWPGVTNKRWGDVGGNLYLSRPTGRIERLDVAKELSHARFRISDGPLNLPRAYFGVVSVEYIKRTTARFGPLFGGCSPDIYSSRLLSALGPKAVTIDLPFIVPGASKTSTSAARAERSDVGELRRNDHTGRFANLEWDPLVPQFYAPFTVWAQSLLQAEAVVGGRPALSSFAYLYAKCAMFTRGNFSAIRGAIRQQSRPVVAAVMTTGMAIYVACAYVVSKLPLLITRNPGAAAFRYGQLLDSEAASISLNRHIDGISLYYDDATR